ncbi:RNA helicase [Synechococcus sp. CS-205]|nr:RNA helicase [Synechococcus sp. CS-205]
MNGSGDPSRRGRRRAGGSLDQWMTAGRQLVDGVAGARPGSRSQTRGGERRAGSRPGLEGLGRWVENRIDWFLEGDDDWTEPWQERPEGPEQWSSQPQMPAPEPATRRPLEAISRRASPLLPPAPVRERQTPPQQPPSLQPESSAPLTGGRPLPRSSRRPRRT